MFMLRRHYHKERQKGRKVLNTWAVKQTRETWLEHSPITQNWGGHGHRWLGEFYLTEQRSPAHITIHELWQRDITGNVDSMISDKFGIGQQLHNY